MRGWNLTLLVVTVAAAGFLAGAITTSRIQLAQAKARPDSGIPGVPGEKGGEDITGPYDVDPSWPKPLSSLPGHEKWTWGAVQGIFAESPNRILIAERGELPLLKRPAMRPVPEFGPSLTFPIGQVPFRHDGMAALPGDTPPGLPDNAVKYWGKAGVDARWEDCIVAVDASGNITERWTQWDSLFKRPHSISINPYDPDKNVWIVDDARHAIFKFSNDGKKLLQTIGTLDQPGADDKHFNRPTYIAWLPDGAMLLSDGYNGTRVVKLDKSGKFLMSWGQKGTPPNDTRPGYFNVVHGIAFDPVTRRVYVVDRSNYRIQVFDLNGKFIDQWPVDKSSSINFLYLSADRHLWVLDGGNQKVVEYDLDGRYLYSWGTLSDNPGGLFNPHGMSVDQQGNFYVAEVANGRAQKFRARAGANPALLVGKPAYYAWK